jgi:hypothetical protein
MEKNRQAFSLSVFFVFGEKSYFDNQSEKVRLGCLVIGSLYPPAGGQ